MQQQTFRMALGRRAACETSAVTNDGLTSYDAIGIQTTNYAAVSPFRGLPSSMYNIGQKLPGKWSTAASIVALAVAFGSAFIMTGYNSSNGAKKYGTEKAPALPICSN